MSRRKSRRAKPRSWPAVPCRVAAAPLETADMGHLRTEVLKARLYLSESRAPATWKAYETDFAHFDDWCDDRGLCPMPAAPTTVALYLASCAGTLCTGTLRRRLAAIAVVHDQNGHTFVSRDPLLQTLMAGIKRTHGSATHPKAALSTAQVRAMVAGLGAALPDLRDRALILVGFAGGLRRSELVALDVGDLVQKPEGLLIRLRRAKGDPEGIGFEKGIPHGDHPLTCPVRALRAWLTASRLTGGAVFRRIDRHGNMGPRLTAQSVSLVVKAARRASLEKAGTDPAEIAQQVGDFSAHSLRAGMVTAAAGAGTLETDIMHHSGHKRRETVARYIRRSSLFARNPAGRLGL